MKFCDKLSKKRKDNNLSQEQFADKLGVSRQAVSKWEQGASYPDMDKIINMCKILNCNLDDLLDDGIIEGKEKNNKIDFNGYFNNFLEFITKVYNMFWSMSFKEKIKCLFELFIIFIVLFLVGMIIYYLLYALIIDNIINIPVIGFVADKILDPLILIALIVVGIIVFLHLFKIRYLDYFITIEDNSAKEKAKEEAIVDEKIIDNKKYIEFHPKEKVIIRDPKHSKYNFFNLFIKVLLYIVKFFIIVFTIPFICLIIFLFALFAICIFHYGYGLLFIFSSLAILGLILISFVILYFIYNFIFNREIKFKLMFIIFVVGLIFTGVGIGISFVSIMDYDYENDAVLDIDYKEKEEVIKMEDNLIISDVYPLVYTIDNSISDIKLRIILPKETEYELYYENSGNYNICHIDYDGIILSPSKLYDEVKEDLKNHKLRNYKEPLSIEVITNEVNYNKLMENTSNYNEWY